MIFLRTARPILPKPFIPTLIDIFNWHPFTTKIKV
jgi:hypothetical protein